MKKELVEIVSEKNLIFDGRIDNYKVDGKKPEYIVFPENVKQISKIIELAAKEDSKIIPWGSGTKICIGNIPTKIDIVLSLENINKIIEFNPGDLTVYVEAGIKLSDLNQILFKEGLFLPVDPPFSDSCTIGGIVNTDSNGPLRQKYGKIKEMITGMKIMLADGSVVNTGAKVVKNASGYNISRLYVGSMGTIGVVTEIGLKLQPIPETIKNAILTFESISDFIDFTDSVRNSFLIPSYIEYISPSFLKYLSNEYVDEATGNHHLCLLGFDGFSETVDWQIEQVKSLCEKYKSIISSEKGDFFLDQVRNFRSLFENSVIFKINIVIPEFENVLKKIKKITLEYEPVFISHFRSGIIYVIFKLPENLDDEGVVDELTNRIEKTAVDSGGSYMVENIPLKFKERISVWGSMENNLEIMKKIKQQFDPNNIFNPGRFVGGI